PALDREPHGGAERVAFCREGAGCEMSLVDGELIWQGEPLLESAELRLLGAHNVENAMAAAAAALASGVPQDAVTEGLKTFEGVAHRLESVREYAGVVWVNDSKATNVSAALAGIEAFDGGLHLIAGGSVKGESFEGLADAVAERASAVHLIGEAAERIAEALAGTGVPIHRDGTLEAAVASAAGEAVAGEVVLLSPACASFDQFRDYEARGGRFRELVEALS
ncbi:MAG: UDP-N-acetylmuramoyl-L-alanine--D-glutamate ligase, partial [Solirubrobacterales bacterium]|nr:UDP-N-acetylmuramoyl-L-alanine--D-glutamate ligase [Solirubrobacterales bacterium]